MPNPVEVRGPITVHTQTRSIEWQPPGLVAAAIYASGDALGRVAEIKVPVSGIIQSATFWDRDNEGTQVDLVIFSSPLGTEVADNAAMDLNDDDLLRVIKLLQFSTFSSFTSGQVSFLDSIGKAYVAPSGKLYVQAITRATPTIAAGSEPRFQFDILADA